MFYYFLSYLALFFLVCRVLIIKFNIDSVNFGGGYSSSSNYQLESTSGEIATGNSSSTNYQMRAGYQQMNSAYIAITGPGIKDIGNVSGLMGGAIGSSTSVTVITDSYGGYQMTVRASTSPAMKSGSYQFTDYVPAGSNPDYVFIIDQNKADFGFSVSIDVIQKFKNDGSSCNAGLNTTPERCWTGFATSSMIISERHNSNHPAGTDTSFYYKAVVGNNKIQVTGAYQADLIVTAIAL